MILILSETSDIPTIKLVTLMKSHHVDYRIIYADELTDVKWDLLNDNLRVNNIDVLSCKSVWFRRPCFDSYIHLVSGDLISDFTKHLIQEKKVLFDAILSKIFDVCPKHIGNPLFQNTNKLDVLQKAKKCGFQIPETIITTNKKTLANKPYVSKPISEVFVRDIDGCLCYSYTENIKLSEVQQKFHYALFQEKIKKEFECKAIFLNGKTYAMAMVPQTAESMTDIRNYSLGSMVMYSPVSLSKPICIKLEELFGCLNLNFGIVDLIIDETTCYFTEINPIGQFDDIVQCGNYPVYDEILKYLES
ncbi:MAG: RimK-like protein [bacterium P3]|nr:MAG: RimK-like protein [bacterium P3]KWW41871.1 MAG: RimK-like protein [bacterium F083]